MREATPCFPGGAQPFGASTCIPASLPLAVVVSLRHTANAPHVQRVRGQLEHCQRADGQEEAAI